jgi:hypothetical protein
VLQDADRAGGSISVATGSGTLARVRRVAGRRLPLAGEMAFLAIVIAIWELLRIPIQGSHELSLSHARDWLALEQALYLDIEAAVIRWVHEADLIDLLQWGYHNFHLPVLFGFMALARQLRPERYPFIRSAFVLSHVPALIVIALYPLLPPRWVPGMPFAVPAPEGMNGPMHNATAAAVSQHVGYPILIAASVVVLAPRSRLAWLAWLYPAAVFLIIVGTSNHYTLDAIIGGLCVATGFAAARLLHGPRKVLRREPTPALALAIVSATGYACIVRAINMASNLSLPPAPVTGTDMLLLGGAALVAMSWWWSRGDPSGSTRWEPTGEPQPQEARSGA